MHNYFVGRNLIGIILIGIATNPIDAILSRTPKHNHTDTITAHQSNTPKLVQEETLSDVSYVKK